MRYLYLVYIGSLLAFGLVCYRAGVDAIHTMQTQQAALVHMAR